MATRKGPNLGGVIGAVALGLLGVGALALVFSPKKKQPPEDGSNSDPELLALAKNLLARAAGVLGITPPPLVATSKIGNAASDGHRVLVNLAWMRAVLQRFCDDSTCSVSVVLGVMAHEAAHHMNGDALYARGNAHDKELRADYTAGWTMAQLGIEPHHLEHVIGEIGRFASDSHPAGSLRVQAIRRGYIQARQRVA